MNKYLKIAIPILTVAIIIADIFLLRQNLGARKITLRGINQIVNNDKSLRDYYQMAQQMASQQPQTATATFLAGGDIMLSRNVAATMQKANDPDLPFKNMASILKSTDFNFANLESPIAPKQAIIGGHSMIFGAPENYIQGLNDFNFKVLNLANNHAFDQGLSGLDFTKKVLDQNNILHTGTGDTLDEAWKPEVVTANGVNICFIGASYASINDSGKTYNNYVARIEQTDKLKSSIVLAKTECDFVVVTMHAGTEYTSTPNAAQIAFAHAAIDNGADMVIGGHPHWVQTIEKYCPGDPQEKAGTPFSHIYDPTKCRYIFYSLGNFIFDQEWSQETKEGLTLKIQISKNRAQNPAAPGAATLEDLQGPRQPAKLESVELVPIILENYSTPRPATPNEAKNILDKIGQKNTELIP